MCGRITQIASPAAYASAIGWDAAAIADLPDQPTGNYNGTPGADHWIMHRLADEDRNGMTRLHWGYRPKWAAEKRLPISINARIEKAASGAYFRGMWKSGRIVVPADGWYEWTGAAGRKQPWYIRLKTEEPMFMAAITNYRPGKELPEDGGFVIVTAAAEGGMVDVHDRRPVVLNADDAGLWLDPGFSAEQAEQLARSGALPPDAFEWYEVSRDVNKVGNQSPLLIEPA